MFLHFLQIDGMVPWWAPVILGAMFILSGALNVVQARWKTAAEAADSELKILRESRERLITEKEAMAKQVGELQARTNLDAVQERLTTIEKSIAKESAEAQIKIVGMIQTVTKEMMEGFRSHAAEDREFQRGLGETLTKVCSVLDGMDKRVTDGFSRLQKAA